MAKGLIDYLITNQGGLLTLDIDRLMKLSDKKFRKKHIEENKIFIFNHEKEKGNKPYCEYCEGFVEKPEELVREHGGSSHILCFEPIYHSELREKFPKEEQRYFDRIVEVFS